uniref:DZIP3-like HEPN domain-containing protein n=1 Tax=Panagrolaimus davidi TaxID=227884 RepID=A0A914Q3U2_9BILA
MDPEQLNRILNKARVDQLLAFGLKRLRHIFRDRWSDYRNINPLTIIEWNDDNASGIQTDLESGKCSEWDITALTCALNGLYEEIKIVRGNLSKAEENERLTVQKFKDMRNNFSHMGTSELTDDQFKTFWDDIANILTSLGVDIVDMDTLKEELSNSNLGKLNEREVAVDKTKISNQNKKARELFKEGKFKDAIEIFTEILKHPRISSEDQAIILANRGEAYLMLQEKSYDQKGKNDAELSILLMPTWWKGHFCIGILQKEENDLPSALKSFETAFALNQNSDEVFVEYTKILYKLGILSGFEHCYKVAETKEDDITDACRKASITEEQLENNVVKEEHIKPSNIAETQHSYALKCFHGHGVNKDFQKASEWFERAAKNGYAASANNLGLMYKHGQGVSRSLEKAFKFFKQAAENGNTHGMLNLAYCYFLADGCMRWIQCAADKGDLVAKMELKRRKDYNYSNILTEFSINHSCAQRIPESDQRSFEKALSAAEMALKMYPKSFLFLYLHVLTLTLTIKSEMIKAADIFLAAAPNDHEYVPTCHYLKAKFYYATLNFPNFVKEFEKGLEMEKLQLPCFLPYQFPEKDLMEKLYLYATK